VRLSLCISVNQPSANRFTNSRVQLGFKLFERNHQTVELTDAGRAFVEEAREVLLHAERAVIAAKAVFNGADQILNLGKSAYTDPFLISTILSVRPPLFPGLRIKQWSNYSNELARQVIAGTLDLAITTGIPENPKLSLLQLADSPFYLAMPEDDQLADHHDLLLEQLHDRIWILLSQQASPSCTTTFCMLLPKRNVSPRDVLQVMSSEEVPELILEHRGVAFMPRATAWRISRDEITMRPLSEPRLRLVTNLAVRADSKSRLAKEFVRATSRKLDSLMPSQQRQLPLTG
jgi:DNA-binding transcriptional LysR family regulator